MKRVVPLLIGCLGACLPNTEYVPRRPGAALAVKEGKLALARSGQVVERDGFAPALGCDPQAATFAGRAASLADQADRNAMVGSMFNALTPIFPLAPAIGAIFISRAAGQEARSTAALVDAVNRHNDAPACAGSREARR